MKEVIQKQIEMAIKCLKKGILISEITELTGLSEKGILALNF